MATAAPPSVVVVGSLNADLVTRVPRLPLAGETVLGTSFEVLAGGKGANQAVAAARFGAQVKMIGRVGADAFGALLRQELSRAGVDTAAVVSDPDNSTGTAQILVDVEGRNQIAVAPGANGELSRREVEEAQAWEHAALAVVQLEVPLDAVEAAVRRAARGGVPVVLNAAPARSLPEALLAVVAWLIVNQSEAAALARRPVGTIDEAQRAARGLRGAGQGVIVTLGAGGALMLSEAGALHQPAAEVRAIDTVAAGDAFVGVFAAAMMRGEKPEEALALAVTAGSLACIRSGAIPSLPTAAEVAERRQSLPRPLKQAGPDLWPA